VRFVIPIKTASYVLPYLAQDKGLFEKHGIEAEIKFVPPPAGLNVIVAGDADFALISSPTIEIAHLSGSDVMWVANYVHKPLISLVAKKGVTGVQDLKGGKMAITVPGSITQIFTDRFLRDKGLEPGKDVATRPVGGQGEALQALVAGQVDATFLGSPQDKLAEKQGFTILEDLAKSEYNWTLAGIATQKGYAEKNPETVVKVLAALFEAVKMWKTEADAVQKLIMRETGADAELAKQGYDAVSAVIDDTPVPEVADVKQTLTELEVSQPKAKGADPAEFMDTKYAEDALKVVGGG
jgi:NitT/TauT family transport system substrate-binding protein